MQEIANDFLRTTFNPFKQKDVERKVNIQK